MPFQRVTGFAPDADTTTPGILTDCDGIIPTLNGVASLPGDADAGLDTAPSAITAAQVLLDLDNSVRLFAGSDTKLYELSTTTWGDVTAAAGDYSATACARWTFAQYNNRSFAANRGDFLQFSDTGNFSAATAPPKAAFVETVLDFVMVANTNGGPGGTDTFGDSPNRWWCSALGYPGDWVPDVGTQCTSGLLTDSPGPITGLKRLGSGIVAYKERSMYIGQYIGPPLVWSWRLVPGEGLGSPSHYAVVDIETAHLFIGHDNIYRFDGTRPESIATNRVAEFFFDDMDFEFKSKIVGFHERFSWRVYWFYPSIGSGGVLDKYLCYNYRSDRWGAGNKTIQFAFEYREPGVAYNDVGTFYATYDDIPAVPYDTLFASSGTFKPAIIDTTPKVQKLEGAAGSSFVTTGDVGTEQVHTMVTQVHPRFKSGTPTGTQTHMYKDNLGKADSTATAATTLSNDGSFDHVWTAQWHKFKQAYSGDYELLGWYADVEQETPE